MYHSMGPVLLLQEVLVTVYCVLVLDVRLAVRFGPLGQHLVLGAAQLLLTGTGLVVSRLNHWRLLAHAVHHELTMC